MASAMPPKNLQIGRHLFLTYSGHGGQAPDLNNEEPDGMDETWCLYDGQLIDDELYSSWGAFASGCASFSCPTVATAAR